MSIYLGVSLAVVGIGVLAAATTLFTAVTAFAAITGTTALTVAAWHSLAAAPAQLCDSRRTKVLRMAGERLDRGEHNLPVLLDEAEVEHNASHASLSPV